MLHLDAADVMLDHTLLEAQGSQYARWLSPGLHGDLLPGCWGHSACLYQGLLLFYWVTLYNTFPFLAITCINISRLPHTLRVV